MGVGISGSRIGTLAVALVAAAALFAALATGAGAARLIGKDGKVYACYKAKGKAKGAVRLVAKKGKCRHGEKKVSWGAAGPTGESGGSGESGTNGESGAAGETGAGGTKGLEGRISALSSKVTALEGVLQGITNTDLVGMLGKLQGISGTQLQETVASLAKVNALCAQTSKVTSQVDALGESLGGLKLVSALPVALETIAPIPTPLSSFACP
jgi:hypothetical protein